MCVSNRLGTLRFGSVDKLSQPLGAVWFWGCQYGVFAKALRRRRACSKFRHVAARP